MRGAWPTVRGMALWLGLLLLWVCPVARGQGVTSAVMRTTNSVDIQVCVSGVLTTQRDSFVTVLTAYLQSKLLSQAVYLDTEYTDAAGDLCFLYVYQAPNPTAAQQAFSYLSPSNTVTKTLDITFAGVDVNGTVTAAQWSGASTSYMGVPLPLDWTLNDLLLWGSCGVGAVALCAGAGCCYVLRSRARDDDDEARALLRTDDEILRLLERRDREQDRGRRSDRDWDDGRDNKWGRDDRGDGGRDGGRDRRHQDSTGTDKGRAASSFTTTPPAGRR